MRGQNERSTIGKIPASGPGSRPIVRVQPQRAFEDRLPIKEPNLAVSAHKPLRIWRKGIHGVEYIGEGIRHSQTRCRIKGVVYVGILQVAVAKRAGVIPGPEE